MSTRPDPGDERGVTLVELLVAITILGIIIVPLVEAFIVGLRTTAQASTSLGSSHDTQLTDYYFQRDAGGAIPAVPTGPGLGTCATAAGVTTGQAVVSFSWRQAQVMTGTTLASGLPAYTLGTTYEADYVYVGTKLVRYFCSGTSPTGAQATTVASSLSRTTAPTASIGPCTTKGQQGTCTTVVLTDSTGNQYTTILLQRTF